MGCLLSIFMIGFYVFVNFIATLGLVEMAAFNFYATTDGKTLYENLCAFNAMADAISLQKCIMRSSPELFEYSRFHHSGYN